MIGMIKETFPQLFFLSSSAADNARIVMSSLLFKRVIVQMISDQRVPVGFPGLLYFDPII